ncbi:MAG: hypothetical protein WA902_08800 [Thermosynechococcaceae cyanobacterium]
MSERLDRIEGILEAIAQREGTQQLQIAQREETRQLQIDVMIETQLELQQGHRELQQGQHELQQALQSLAKSVPAHCDDSNRHN